MKSKGLELENTKVTAAGACGSQYRL